MKRTEMVPNLTQKLSNTFPRRNSILIESTFGSSIFPISGSGITHVDLRLDKTLYQFCQFLFEKSIFSKISYKPFLKLAPLFLKSRFISRQIRRISFILAPVSRSSQIVMNTNPSKTPTTTGSNPTTTPINPTSTEVTTAQPDAPGSVPLVLPLPPIHTFGNPLDTTIPPLPPTVTHSMRNQNNNNNNNNTKRRAPESGQPGPSSPSPKKSKIILNFDNLPVIQSNPTMLASNSSSTNTSDSAEQQVQHMFKFQTTRYKLNLLKQKQSPTIDLTHSPTNSRSKKQIGTDSTINVIFNVANITFPCIIFS